MQHVHSTSDANFENDVLNAERPVLVDFWAEWCHPCKMLTPVLEEVAGEFSNRVLFYKLNVDDNTETPSRYGVRGIPSLLLFKGGNLVGTRVGGAWSKSQLSSFLEEAL